MNRKRPFKDNSNDQSISHMVQFSLIAGIASRSHVLIPRPVTLPPSNQLTVVHRSDTREYFFIIIFPALLFSPFSSIDSAAVAALVAVRVYLVSTSKIWTGLPNGKNWVSNSCSSKTKKCQGREGHRKQTRQGHAGPWLWGSRGG